MYFDVMGTVHASISPCCLEIARLPTKQTSMHPDSSWHVHLQLHLRLHALLPASGSTAFTNANLLLTCCAEVQFGELEPAVHYVAMVRLTRALPARLLFPMSPIRKLIMSQHDLLKSTDLSSI